MSLRKYRQPASWVENKRTRFREKCKPAFKPIILPDDEYCPYCVDEALPEMFSEEDRVCNYCGDFIE